MLMISSSDLYLYVLGESRHHHYHATAVASNFEAITYYGAPPELVWTCCLGALESVAAPVKLWRFSGQVEP